MGYEQPQTYFYKLDDRNMLIATGYYISAYGESYIQELNDIYLKY